MNRGARHIHRSTRGRVKRRGVATLMALTALAVALATCYAILRVQSNAQRVQSNARHQQRARRAAFTGLNVALTKMHTAAWAGVGGADAGMLDSNTRYEVDFIAGDDQLPAGDARWPFRVTIECRGYCQQDYGPEVRSDAVAVVQLTPRNTASQPANWSDLQGANVYQWGNSELEFELPSRIEGALRTQGPIAMAPTTPPDHNEPFFGRIDEVAYWDSALSAADIAQIYSDSIAGQLVSSYSNLSPDSWFRLDEISPAASADNSSNGWTGQYVGPALGQTGCPGETNNLAPLFDGANDCVRIGDSGYASNLTAIGWFNEDGVGLNSARSCILGRGAGPAASEQSWSAAVVDVAGTRRLEFRIHVGGAVHTVADTTTAISTGTWYFFAAVYDGANIRLYVNGSLTNTIAASGAIQTPSNTTVAIGDLPPGASKAAYLAGLEDNHDGTPYSYGTNDRPLPGTVETPLAALPAIDRDLIENVLGATLVDLPASNQPPAAFPATMPYAYRLFDGGSLYSAGSVGAYVSNTTLGPTAANPLGIYIASGSVEFGSSVTLQGCLIVDGSVTLNGSNIQFSAVTLPALDGATSPTELPVIVADQKLKVGANANASVRGLVVAWDGVFVLEGANGNFELTGELATNRLQIEPRTDWNTSASWWIPKLAQWAYDESQGYGHETFPGMLSSNYGLSSTPETTFSVDASQPAYHWQDWTTAVYAPAPGDTHLRWSVVRLRETP